MHHRTQRRALLLGLGAFCSAPLVLQPALAGKKLLLTTAAQTPLGPGEQPGFADSVALEAFRRIGIEARVDTLPAERALINADAGIEDGDVLRTRVIEPHFPNLVRVPELVLPFEFTGYSRNWDLEVNRWEDLLGHPVGILKGVRVLELRVKNHSDLTVVKTIKQLFTLLVNRRVDVVLAERWTGLWWIKRLGLDVKVIAMPGPPEPMFIYLHKRHAHLVAPLAKAIRNMKADGAYARIFLKTLAPLETTRP